MEATAHAAQFMPKSRIKVPTKEVSFTVKLPISSVMARLPVLVESIGF